MFGYVYCVGVTGRRERIPCKPCRRTGSSEDEDEGKDNDGARRQARQDKNGCDAAGSAANEVGLSLSPKSSLGPSSLLPSPLPLCFHYPLLSTSITLLSTSTTNLLSLPPSSSSLLTPALYNAGNRPGKPQASKKIEGRSQKGW